MKKAKMIEINIKKNLNYIPLSKLWLVSRGH